MKITELTGKLSSDQTGYFTIMSRKVNKYVMVLYDHNTNKILEEPLASRSQQDTPDAQINLHDYLTYRGFTLRVKILDTECSEALKRHF